MAVNPDEVTVKKLLHGRTVDDDTGEKLTIILWNFEYKGRRGRTYTTYSPEFDEVVPDMENIMARDVKKWIIQQIEQGDLIL